MRRYFPHRGRSRPDLAAHQADQPLHNREAESASAEFPRGRSIGLGETRKHRGDLVGGDSDAAVVNREADVPGMPRLADCVRSRPALDPASVNLIALPIRLLNTWRRWHESPITTRAVRRRIESRVRRPFSWARIARVSAAFSLKSTTSNSSFSRLSLPLSTLARSRMLLMNSSKALPLPKIGIEIAALLGIELAFANQISHPEDGVHRGADLVRHDGDEFRFGFGGRQRGLARVDQVGNIAGRGERAGASVHLD